LRTYHHPNAQFDQCKIWEAARATSAAPFYFPTAKIQEQKFWDDALANNNPASEVLTESAIIFPGQEIKCFVSLGTGLSVRSPKRSLVPMLGKGRQIMKNITNTERVHVGVAERMERHPDSYFRLNANLDKDEIGLADYKLLDKLEEHTRTYLLREDVQVMIEQCAQRLARIPVNEVSPVRVVGQYPD
jgi:predicted acylesterase/phospholipase RssA